MKKVFGKALCFSLVFICLFLVLDCIFYDKKDTSPVWEMIQNPKNKELDILFIGSSNAYTAINPLIINEALGINTAALGSPDLPMDLAYADLKALLHYKKPKVIVLEALTAYKSAYTLCAWGKEGRLYKGIDGMRNPLYRACMVTEVLDFKRWPEAFSQLFRPMLRWRRFKNLLNPTKSYGDTRFGSILGFLPRAGIYSEDTKVRLNVEELEQMNVFGEAGYIYITKTKDEAEERKEALVYLQKFLQLTDQENIPVFIIKTPVIKSGFVDLVKEIENISWQYKNVKGVYNYNTQLTAIGLSVDDFSDDMHLNRVGAGKFTVFLTDRIGVRLNIKPDYSKVCYYKNEFVKPLSNGLYRYHVEMFPNSLIRFVIKDRKGKIIKKTPYGKKNFVDTQRIGKTFSLYFNIKPLKKYSNTISPEEQNFKFFKKPEAI